MAAMSSRRTWKTCRCSIVLPEQDPRLYGVTEFHDRQSEVRQGSFLVIFGYKQGGSLDYDLGRRPAMASPNAGWGSPEPSPRRCRYPGRNHRQKQETELSVKSKLQSLSTLPLYLNTTEVYTHTTHPHTVGGASDDRGSRSKVSRYEAPKGAENNYM